MLSYKNTDELLILCYWLNVTDMHVVARRNLQFGSIKLLDM